MKYLIIVNPTSGRGYAGKMIPQIEALLHAHNLEFDIVWTERKWHAAELAENAARQGYDVVALASGDGTLNEALNGLMRARQAGYDRTAMSILPVGTGNDAAYGLGQTNNLGHAVSALAAGQRRVVDVGLVHGGDYPQGRFFINGVGVGFDAAVGFVAVEIRWARGLLAYLIAVIQTVFLYYKAPVVELEYNGRRVVQPSLLVSVMNGRRMGGGFYTAPQGNPSDGQLDLCIASEAGRLRIFRLIPHFLKGSQASQPEIRMDRTNRITIKAVKGTLPAHCDGETLCRSGEQLTVGIIPQAMEFVISTSG